MELTWNATLRRPRLRQQCGCKRVLQGNAFWWEWELVRVKSECGSSSIFAYLVLDVTIHSTTKDSTSDYRQTNPGTTIDIYFVPVSITDRYDRTVTETVFDTKASLSEKCCEEIWGQAFAFKQSIRKNFQCLVVQLSWLLKFDHWTTFSEVTRSNPGKIICGFGFVSFPVLMNGVWSSLISIFRLWIVKCERPEEPWTSWTSG